MKSFLQWKTAKQLEVNKTANYDLMLELHEMKRRRLRTVYGGVSLFPFHGAICHQTSIKLLRAKGRKHQYKDMPMIFRKECITKVLQKKYKWSEVRTWVRFKSQLQSERSKRELKDELAAKDTGNAQANNFGG